jgi:hypothetical protein
VSDNDRTGTAPAFSNSLYPSIVPVPVTVPVTLLYRASPAPCAQVRTRHRRQSVGWAATAPRPLAFTPCSFPPPSPAFNPKSKRFKPAAQRHFVCGSVHWPLRFMGSSLVAPPGARRPVRHATPSSRVSCLSLVLVLLCMRRHALLRVLGAHGSVHLLDRSVFRHARFF